MKIDDPIFAHAFFERYVSDDYGSTAEVVLKQLSECDPGEFFARSATLKRGRDAYFLPYGYQSLGGGHMVTIVVDPSKSYIAIANSGSGVSDHHDRSGDLYNVVTWYQGTQFAQCEQAFRFLSADKTKLSFQHSATDYSKQFQSQKQQHPGSPEELYRVVHAVLGMYKMKRVRPYTAKWALCNIVPPHMANAFAPNIQIIQGDLYSKLQISGTCTYHSALLAMIATQTSKTVACLYEEGLRAKMLSKLEREFTTSSQRQLCKLLRIDYNIKTGTSVYPPYHKTPAELDTGLRTTPQELASLPSLAGVQEQHRQMLTKTLGHDALLSGARYVMGQLNLLIIAALVNDQQKRGDTNIKLVLPAVARFALELWDHLNAELTPLVASLTVMNVTELTRIIKDGCDIFTASRPYRPNMMTAEINPLSFRQCAEQSINLVLQWNEAQPDSVPRLAPVVPRCRTVAMRYKRAHLNLTPFYMGYVDEESEGRTADYHNLVRRGQRVNDPILVIAQTDPRASAMGKAKLDALRTNAVFHAVFVCAYLAQQCETLIYGVRGNPVEFSVSGNGVISGPRQLAPPPSPENSATWIRQSTFAVQMLLDESATITAPDVVNLLFLGNANVRLALEPEQLFETSSTHIASNFTWMFDTRWASLVLSSLEQRTEQGKWRSANQVELAYLAASLLLIKENAPNAEIESQLKNLEPSILLDALRLWVSKAPASDKTVEAFSKYHLANQEVLRKFGQEQQVEAEDLEHLAEDVVTYITLCLIQAVCSRSFDSMVRKCVYGYGTINTVARAPYVKVNTEYALPVDFAIHPENSMPGDRYQLGAELTRDDGARLVFAVDGDRSATVRYIYQKFVDAGFPMTVWAHADDVVEIDARWLHVICKLDSAEIVVGTKSYRVNLDAPHLFKWTDVQHGAAFVVNGTDLLVLTSEAHQITHGATVFDHKPLGTSVHLQNACITCPILTNGLMLDLTKLSTAHIYTIFALYAASGNASQMATLHWYVKRLTLLNPVTDRIGHWVKEAIKECWTGSPLRYLLSKKQPHVAACARRRLGQYMLWQVPEEEKLEVEPVNPFAVRVKVKPRQPPEAQSANLTAFVQSLDRVTLENKPKIAAYAAYVERLWKMLQKRESRQVGLVVPGLLAATLAQAQSTLVAVEQVSADNVQRLAKFAHPHYLQKLTSLKAAELVFAASSSKTLTKAQHDLVLSMTNSEIGPTIYEAIMGFGKSAVLVPVLVLDAVMASRHVFLVQPQHLVQPATKIVLQALALCGLQHKATVFQDGLHRFASARNPVVLVMSGAAAKVELLQLRLAKQKPAFENVTVVFDEIDSLLDPLSSNYNEPETPTPHPVLSHVDLPAYVEYIWKTVHGDRDNPVHFEPRVADKIDRDWQTLKVTKRHNRNFGSTRTKLTNPMVVPYTSPDHPVEDSSYSDPEIRNLLTVWTKEITGLRPSDFVLLQNHVWPLVQQLPRRDADRVLRVIGLRDGLKDFQAGPELLCSKYGRDAGVSRFYVTQVLLPLYSKNFSEQHNISFVDVAVLGSRKVAFSGTVSIHVPETSGSTAFAQEIVTNPEVMGGIEAAILDLDAGLQPQDTTALEWTARWQDLMLAAAAHDALIDEAAAFKDMSPADVWEGLCQHDPNISLVYFNERGEATTLGKGSKSIAYYDTTHIVGVDYTLAVGATGLVVVNVQSTLTRVAQAAFRMRGLHRGQHVHFIGLGTSADIDSRPRLLKMLRRNERALLKNSRGSAAIQNLNTLVRMRHNHLPITYKQPVPYELVLPTKPKLVSEVEERLWELSTQRGAEPEVQQEVDVEEEEEAEEEKEEQAQHDSCFRGFVQNGPVTQAAYTDPKPRIKHPTTEALKGLGIVLSPLAQQTIGKFQNTLPLLLFANKTVMIVHPIEVEAAHLPLSQVFNATGLSMDKTAEISTSNRYVARLLIGADLRLDEQILLLKNRKLNLKNLRLVLKCFEIPLRWLLREIHVRSGPEILADFTPILDKDSTFTTFLLGDSGSFGTSLKTYRRQLRNMLPTPKRNIFF